jgi:type IVB pilus formation R64 PilN family outer membrane protein
MNVNVGGSSSGSGASNSLTMTNSAKLEFWKNIETSIKSMIDAKAKLCMDPCNGTVAVTADPNDIKKVAKFINEQNARLSRQVAISVKVLQVEVSNDDLFGYKLSAVITKGNHLKKTAWEQLPLGGEASPSSTLLMGLVKGKLDLDATIQALSREGNVQLVTSGTVTTMNNKAAPLQVTRTENYVKSMEVTTYNNDTTGSAADPEVEELKTGFMMSVLPRILDHGRLMMYFNLSLSEKVGMETIDLGTGQSISEGDTTSGMGYINNPTTESRNFTQELAMKSGETLILAGYEKNSDNLQKQGTGSPDNMLLGGGVSANRVRTIIVVMLTPVVMESPLDPESRMRD